MAEYDHAALLGRQHAHQLAYVLAGLLLHDYMLGVLVGQLEVVDDVALRPVGHDGHLVVAAEIVHNQVVGDAHDPMDELVFILVLVAVDGDWYVY